MSGKGSTRSKEVHMSKITLALALVGAAGLAAGCGAAEESGTAPTESGSNPVTAPIESAESAAADVAAAASQGETHTLTFTVDGMT
jgi:hypothetical protein